MTYTSAIIYFFLTLFVGFGIGYGCGYSAGERHHD